MCVRKVFFRCSILLNIECVDGNIIMWGLSVCSRLDVFHVAVPLNLTRTHISQWFIGQKNCVGPRIAYHLDGVCVRSAHYLQKAKSKSKSHNGLQNTNRINVFLRNHTKCLPSIVDVIRLWAKWCSWHVFSAYFHGQLGTKKTTFHCGRATSNNSKQPICIHFPQSLQTKIDIY